MSNDTLVKTQTFELFGQTWTIEYVKDLAHREGSGGRIYYRQNRIEIQVPIPEAWERPETRMEETVYHEIFHAIYYAIGREDLRVDEGHIKLMAGALHQVLKSFLGNINVLKKNLKID